ncbi:signal peptidase I [Priestia megaterium]|uniref:signal peptidase I n=1 Tax=Priestia megaterium TaxID=1404 RepID=UPI001C4A4312|nr:signal peptidase I [Priestia megaterium]
MQTNNKQGHLLKALIDRNGLLELPAEGTSMYPLIKQGDICRFTSIKHSPLKRGDIVLFESPANKLIAHRLLNCSYVQEEECYIFKGDTNYGVDDLVTREKIIGKLVVIQKKSVTIQEKNVAAVLWGKLILAFPLLSVLLRSYINYQEWKKAD